MNTVVVAGAGTGKTYALVQRYISYVLEGIHPSAVLAVTFTEKAAAEMRSRVTSTLLKEARTYARGLQSAPICTFHSFCAQLIRENAHVWGLDPAFDLLTPVDERALCLEIAQSVILGALAKDELHVDQLVARFQLKRFGEAKGLAENMVSLHQQMTEHGILAHQLKIPPGDDVSSLIHDVRAAIAAFRATKLSGKSAERLDTIESAFTNLTPNPSPPSGEGNSTLEVVYSHAYRELRDAMSGRFGSDEARTRLVEATTRLGSALVHAVTTPETVALQKLLTDYSVAVMAHKIRHDTLGFSDLLVLARQLLRENLPARQRVKDRFKRILVDEFQDTSPLQEDIVALLCEDRKQLMTLHDGERAMSRVALEPDVLYVVGDPRQSIYGFRGADVELFNEVRSRVDNRESLTLCRRSQGAIVQLVNCVAAVTMGDMEGLTALKESRACAGAIWNVEGSDDVAREIKRLIDEEGAQAKDFAVLVRRIKAAGPIVRSLRAIGVPARIFGGEGFFERPEIMDMISALKLAIDRDDDMAALAVLRSPLVNMSDSDFVSALNRMGDWKQGVPWKRLVEVDDRLCACDRVLNLISSQLGEISIAQAIDYFLDDLKYLEAMAGEPDADERLANVNKLRAMTMNDRLDAHDRIRQLWDFLDDPPRESLAEPLEADSNAVLLMTIHQSKGLEFERVVMADMTSALQNETDEMAFDPDAGLAITHRGRPIAACAPDTTEAKRYAPTPIDVVRQRRRARVEAELSRLLYVAMTRAKEYLYVVNTEAEDRGLSLRRLLWRARDQNPERFNALLPTSRGKLPRHYNF